MLKGLIISIISATFYGLLAVFFKFGYNSGLDTATMLSFRFIFATIILLPYIILFKRKKLLVSRHVILMAIIGGTFFYGAQSYFFAAAIEYISASTTSLIFYLYPMMVVIISALIFKSKIHLRTFITLIFILIGCVCVLYDAFNRNMNLTGVIFAFLAMITFSFYLIFIQKALINVDSTVFSFYIILFTALQCIVVYTPFSISHITFDQWKILLLLGLFPTAIAVLLLYKAIDLIGSANTSIFSSIEPAITVLASALLLNDDVKLIQITGMLCIIAGIVLPNIKQLKTNNLK